ncbi:MAG TPA: class I SAM-dependent methyltransferase [Vicinamibacteria bacterium]|nr:class I SAM-dependent methyltransferase [Vicinamibacteria bacterium]
MLAAAGLAGLAREAMAAWRARDAREGNEPLRRAGAPDGLPLPPDRLIQLVAGTADIGWFLEGGARAAASIQATLAAAGAPLEGVRSLLDFGCGCGRVARRWAGLTASVHGCDLNPRLAAWCRKNLPFGRFVVNRLDPPLPYDDGAFDLAYALSVFTHLPERSQRAWMDEMHRVIRPGGHLIVTTHGPRYGAGLDASASARFDAGELVVVYADEAGSNACAAYHPEAYVRTHLAPPFEVVAFRPEGALGNPHQDLWLLRRPA